MAIQGLVIINTGHGKGKSTAAFGQAVRAAGQGLKVCIIQFIKGKTTTGEAKAITTAFPDQIELHLAGTGFTWQQDKETVRKAALAGWQLAREKIVSDGYDLIVLDELTYLITYSLVPEEEILALFQARPKRLHLVITGRDASPGLIAYADLVTEMCAIKHPYQKGIKGQKGIEY
ncbi:cob(I)yrinic acid a,c-diamide adenosyltransferase [Thiovibrio frasassiensis]|uniref:corrinoid adenosyltransferase n=1 Tax=Thiovibrio frasassiensis TaxID=2984131 RepID=A0A9X4MLQ8_9BACT|nr:cob(I)yrinic acid a,c-diamide adenosyltransferase [Thiovibrio frasassiensis]MDG4475112.1 cob(I)yrinic acid a,c-diamide adenosyltransferase [Thiovibrio frasassiensis]